MIAYRDASHREINPDSELKSLRDKGVLTKEDTDAVPAMLKLDVEFLPETPAKNSALRFGQLLSYLGEQAEGEKKFNLLETAGRYFLP